MFKSGKMIIHREEESLVDIFAWDLLILFVNSLSRAHQDETSSGKDNIYVLVKKGFFCRNSEEGCLKQL